MRRQLTLIGLVHTLLAVLFSALAGYGMAEDLGLPLVIAGLGTAAGSLVIVYGVLIARSSTMGDLPRAVRTANRGRLLIAGAGAACALLGAWLSRPLGEAEANLATGIALVSGLGLAIFALVADNLGRLAR